MVESAAIVGERVKGSGLKVPEYIPIGYMLTSARLEFYFTEDSLAATELISKDPGPDGLTLYKYRPGPTLRNHVSGYTLEYHDARDQRLLICARLDESSTNYAFGLQPRVDHSDSLVGRIRMVLVPPASTIARNTKSTSPLRTGVRRSKSPKGWQTLDNRKIRGVPVL